MATEQAQVAAAVDKGSAVTAMKHYLEGTGEEVGVLGKKHDWLRGGNTKESRDIGKSTSSLVSPLSLLILLHTCFQGYGQPRCLFSIPLVPLPTGDPEDRQLEGCRA